MGLVVVTSPRSSPGATSLCVGLAMAWNSWDLDPLLVEADPAGGVLGHRFNLSGPEAQRNLQTFAVDTRRVFRGQAMATNVQKIAGIDTLLSPVEPARASQAIAQAAPVIAEHLVPTQRPIVADVGRLVPGSPSLRFVRAAHAALIVLQPEVDQIQAALYQLALLRSGGLQPQLVLVGSGSFSAAEVTHATDAPIAAELPHAPKAAVALAGGKFKKRPFSRSPLWRSIAALAGPLAQTILSDGAESEHAESEHAESEGAEPEHAESEHAESEHAESEGAEPDRDGPESAESESDDTVIDADTPAADGEDDDGHVHFWVSGERDGEA